MAKENFPTQLNAEYYRRKNTMSTTEGPKPPGGGGSEPRTTARPPPPPPPPPPTQQQQQPHHHPHAQQPPMPKPRQGIVRRLATRAKHAAGRTLRIGGTAFFLVAAVGAGSHHYESRRVDEFFGPMTATSSSSDDDGDDEKIEASSSERRRRSRYGKRVLVLPFDNLKVIEHRKSGEIDLGRFAGGGGTDSRPTISIEAKELVNAIHSAASDPNVVALHADFGEGMRHPMGYSHLAEIRDAIKVFNESHRVHREPNVMHDEVFAMMRNGDPKASYAFGHTFRWEEYFLASAFGYVHLQARGNLSLFGVATTNTFLRGALDKYGIKAHVFRHGEYKHAPSVFTNKKYSASHLEAVTSMTSSLDESIRTCIENSRGLNFDKVMWQSIFDYGSLTPTNSVDLGLVDSIPPVDPLISLLDVNKKEAKMEKKKKDDGGPKDDTHENDNSILQNKGIPARKKLEEKFGLHESYAKFAATEAVTLAKYRQMLNKRERVERTRDVIDDALRKMSEKSTATSMILSALGLHPPGGASSGSKGCDRVAVVTVDGPIGGSLSYEIIRSLRKIGEDDRVKSVILRVNSPGGSVVSSEAILEEIKLLDKPVICSMSNAAASGGYYIAMNSEKIFAQPTTITGSIGVFGLKFDATKWAKSYGIHGDYYPHGSHAAAMHPLTPLTPNMKENISRMVLDYYDYFKGIVSTGRSLPIDEVEKVAQGRVWTGEQAKEVGLVDALGGLDRAISYAKKAHTKTERVEVDHWPRRTFRLEDLPGLLAGREVSYLDTARALLIAAMEIESNVEPRSVERMLNELTELKFAEKPHFMATVDEKTAMDIILRGE